ncbi:hypothetical protein N0V87_009098 [Didymella glomerata]|uniref:Uncharacterized protein n=1 Tax=Didymella glomerata TaxID=749621 RepID=A0A9W9BVZ7_9PLEO|nr:hypothetical protein N0V87_009098 [Didymella glomerata]
MQPGTSQKRQGSAGTITEQIPQSSPSSQFFLAYYQNHPAMAQFRTTKLVSRGSAEIPLFWFVQSDDEQRANIEKALDMVVDQIVEESSQMEKKQIVSVPWLRNYAASAADVFATARGFEMGEGHILGIDAQSLEDGTLLVFHCLSGKDQEIGRAGREEAIRVLLKEQLYKYTLAEAFDGRAWTATPFPKQTPETTLDINDTVYVLPPHIPSDVKLRKDAIVLFSLINLTDDEISVLKQDMGDTANEITIYNWPHATPASQAETYNIFQCVKPEAPVHDGQTFVMFIDAAYLSGPRRAPVVVVACESAAEVAHRAAREVAGDGSRVVELEKMRYCHIYLRAEYSEAIKALWPLIWHPPNRGHDNGVAVNYPLFYGSRHHSYDPTTSAAVDWEHPVARYGTNFISKPGLAVEVGGATAPEYVAYILCPVTPEEIRTLRNILQIYGNAPSLLELNIVTRLSKAEREEKKSSKNSSARLGPLLAFFDTPAYRAVADPPSTFIFLDNEALDHLLTSVSEGLSVPIATTCRFYHGEGLIAVEEPGYQFADIALEDGLESTLANLSVGNM